MAKSVKSFFDKNEKNLRELYKIKTIPEIATFTGFGVATVWNHFKRLEIEMKSPRFKKGQLPWNTGKKASSELKKILSKVQKKRFEKEDVWNKGKANPYSKESLIKMGKSQKKRFQTEDGWNKGMHGFMAGEKHYNWQGGKTSESKRIRHSLKYRNWREAVFERDDYICQKCRKRGCYLHPHHLLAFSKFPKVRFDVDNGLTLCKDCHWELHRKKSHADGELQYIGFGQ